jgi:hypothetical protein
VTERAAGRTEASGGGRALAKASVVPQQLGAGSTVIQPSYIQSRLGVTFVIPP